jgi:hypothetical protein
MSRKEEQENIIKRLDSIIRSLSQSRSEIESSEDIQKIKDKVEQDDKPRLATLLEDTIVLLKDDPQNRVKIKEKLNRIWNGYGHIKPLAEVTGEIKKYYLMANSTGSGNQ